MEKQMESKTENNEEKESLTMADRFVTAMFLPKEYGKLLQQSVGRLIQYLFVLLLLVAVIRYAIPMFGAIASLGGVKNIIMEEIPEFALDNGTFYFGEPVEHVDEINGIYIIVDTDVDTYTQSDIPANAIEAILVGNKNMIVYNQVVGMGGMVQEYNFKDFQGVTIDNATVASQSPWIYLSIIGSLLFIYVFEIVKYLGTALLYAGVVYLFARGATLHYRFGEVYKVALYAQSIGVVVCAIVYCVNNTILILAGSTFAMLITLSIMNRVMIDDRSKSMYL